MPVCRAERAAHIGEEQGKDGADAFFVIHQEQRERGCVHYLPPVAGKRRVNTAPALSGGSGSLLHTVMLPPKFLMSP